MYTGVKLSLQVYTGVKLSLQVFTGVKLSLQVYTGVKFLALNEPEDDMGWHARLQVEPMIL